MLGWIAIYVDVEKSYHLLKWDFVVDTPHDIGLPVSFIYLVEYCISTYNFQVLWIRETPVSLSDVMNKPC